MCKTTRTLLTLALALFITGASQAQADRPAAEEKTVTFVFKPGDDSFLLKGNETELERLYALLDRYRTEIRGGTMPVYVNGCCASLPTAKENLRTACVRANRVKSELIVHKGLKEADFVTANHVQAYGGNTDAVVVRLRLPAKGEPRPREVVKEAYEQEEPPMETVSRPEPAVEKQPQPPAEPTPEPVAESVPKPAVPAKPYCFAVRTNVLYDALLLPSLGVEWRINRALGLKLDGSFARWGDDRGKVQKIWALSPEVRWYLLPDKRFYAGASANYGEYNVYKYVVGSLVSKDTGYQGDLWGAGLTAGYQLYLSRGFSVDFHLGLGYTRLEYDRFTVTDRTRVVTGKDKAKNLWGPTQAGISLVWTMGGK